MEIMRKRRPVIFCDLESVGPSHAGEQPRFGMLKADRLRRLATCSRTETSTTSAICHSNADDLR